MTFARGNFQNPAREQWDRVERWYERLLAAESGYDREDFAIVLLGQCWALRDWLIGSRIGKQADVEALYQEPDMKLCRDVANAAKHLDSRDASAAVGLFICWEYAPDEPGQAGLVPLADDKHDVRQLCVRCRAKASEVLAEQRLHVPAVAARFLGVRRVSLGPYVAIRTATLTPALGAKVEPARACSGRARMFARLGTRSRRTERRFPYAATDVVAVHSYRAC